MCEICLKLTIKRLEQTSFGIQKFEQISNIVLVFSFGVALQTKCFVNYVLNKLKTLNLYERPW